MLPPRIIHKKAELKKISEITEAMAGQKLSKDQTDYFDLLCRLIEDYERQEKERFENRQKRGNPAKLAEIRQLSVRACQHPQCAEGRLAA